MERVENVENDNEEIDEYYVVDAWCEKQGPDISDNNTGGKNIDVSPPKEDPISRRKPTEDKKTSNHTNEPTVRDKSSVHRRRLRSRSPYGSSLDFSTQLHLGKKGKNQPTPERGRSESHMDITKIDEKRDRRQIHKKKGLRSSRSRSKEKLHSRGQSPRRLYRSHISRSPIPLKRKTGNENRMNPSCPPYYQNPGFRDGFPKGSLPPNPSFMNSNIGIPSVQYPINPVSSVNSFGQYPGYETRPNMFESGPPDLGFQQTIGPNFPQNQYPPSYQGYNPSIPTGLGENPPNPVPFPTAWNQSNLNFNNSQSNLPAGAVMYPHLKIGQPRADIYNRNKESSLGSSPRHKQGRSSLENRKYSKSKSPDLRKHKKKSKRRSKSPSRKYEERDERYETHSWSPLRQSRSEIKKPRVIIDPNRIPTPPPPPIVGSYEKDERKSNDSKVKVSAPRPSDNNLLSGFLNKDKVSLSCLLEAVMENSGQGKSQLSNPKVKKEIISKCESKIQHLYKRRMTGLGAFIPDPIQPSLMIENASPLTAVYSHFTYNCGEENSEWHCPGIKIPQVKMKEKQCFDKAQRVSGPLQQHSDIERISGAEVIPTLTNSQTIPNWERSIPQLPSQQNSVTSAYGNSQHNSYPAYLSSHNWSNPAPLQNAYSIPPPDLPSEIRTLGSPCRPPGYMFHGPPVHEFIPPQQNYPPQQEMINYPSRELYPPMQHFPLNSMNPPRMYSALQCDPVVKNFYRFNADEGIKSKKNKSNVNNNLIVLNQSGSQSETNKKTTHKNEKMTVHIDLTRESDLMKKNEAPEDKHKMTKGTNDAKDKLLRKLWQLRKSSDYTHVPVEQQCSKEQEDEFYKKLNYADMEEDTQLDTIHDYQLINLRERIETCLAEGKVSPEHHGSRERRDCERDRQKDKERGRDRERDRTREKDRIMNEPTDSERKRHGRSPPGFERKRHRPSENIDHQYSNRRSKEPPSHKNPSIKSNKDDEIEIISDEETNKRKSSESLLNEGVKNENSKEPPEKTLSTQIFDLLGPEIRKVQEKSDLYKSIIDSLEKGDRAYKRLYAFKNTALTKSERDNKIKLVVPRDSLKELIMSIHKNFHHVQSEELIRYLKDLIFPNMIHLPKCVSKVVSECQTCIEQKKNEEKKEETTKDKKTERKADKKIDRLPRERDKERRNSGERDRDRRISKDKNLSSKSRRDIPRSGSEREKDGPMRPSGYEKAIKVRKTGPDTCTKSPEGSSINKLLEQTSNTQPEEITSEVIPDLNDKALEFKHNDSRFIEAIGSLIDSQNVKQEIVIDSNNQKEENIILTDQAALIDKSNDKLENHCPVAEIEMSYFEVKDRVSVDKVAATSEKTDSSLTKALEKNPNPSDTSNIDSGKEIEGNVAIEEEKVNINKNEEKASSEFRSNIAEINKDISKLDFKGRVRQVQMSSNECRYIIKTLESATDNTSIDPSYLMKGGMLCKKQVIESVTEVKIVAPIDELEEVVNIVHTMSAIHTPPSKVVLFFTKHFTLVDNLKLKVNEFVNKCSNCKMKDN